MQFQADPLPPAMLFREGVACSTKEYPVSKLSQAAAKSQGKSQPEAVRRLGSHACGECDWTQFCLKKFVGEGAKIAASYGVSSTEFMRQHPRGQIAKGHWQEFCGWRNGGLSGAMDCGHCIQLTRGWEPPLQVGNAPPLQDANARPLQDANAPPLQDADAPPLQDDSAPPPQDADAPPLEDGPMATTPRKTASKHALSNPSSPFGSRECAKIRKNESLVCESLELWLQANRPGVYEWVASVRSNQSPRVICLVCQEFGESKGVKMKGKTGKLSKRGFEVSSFNTKGIKTHETMSVTHQQALHYRHTKMQLVPTSSSQKISSQWQAASSQSQCSNQLVLKSMSSGLFEDLKNTQCVGVDLTKAGSTTRAAQVHYISPPPNLISTTIHTQCVPTFQHSNISQQSIPAVAMKACSLTRRPTNM